MMSYAPSLRVKAAAELERRRRMHHATIAADAARYQDDAAAFICDQVWIDDAQDHGLGGGVMPFQLWPEQRRVLTIIIINALTLILKARQLGLSWLVCAYALWLSLYRPGRVVLIFSKGQDEANEMLRRIKVMYHRLAPALRSALPALIKENTEEMEWANGSRIKSMPATKSSGRTYTASLVILDEFAFLQWASELYTALKPTIDGGGKLVILSTANGTGNLFFDLWERASKGSSRFVTAFLDWRARPDRDDAWYAATAADAVQSSLMGQEYPATPDEAFSATSAERFLPSILWWDACQEQLPPLGEYEPLILAADAGVSNDHFSLVGTTRHPARHTDVAVRLVRVWIPPKDGKLDFDVIEQEIDAIIDQYHVVQLTFDAYQLHQMMTRLGRRVWTDEFSQQSERLIADKQTLDLVQQRRLAHDGNMELRQAADNADRQVDKESHKLRIVKRKDDLKIDPLVACSMSAYRCLELNI
jgi:terminase large subunit-like protein